MGRPFDKHIDSGELNALVPSSAETELKPFGLSREAVREAARHVQSCGDCSRKVSKYQHLLGRFSNIGVSGAVPQGSDCPKDVDWYEVTLGLWPELKARQLLLHAATCDHCGPLLRAATSVDADPTPEEERFLAGLTAPSRPDPTPRPVPPPPWQFMRWLVPSLALILIMGVLVTWRPLSPGSLAGAKFAGVAVTTQQQYSQGRLPLDLRLGSQQTLNEWLKDNSPFSLTLPSPAAPGEDRPYRLEGARLVQVSGKAAVFIAYQMQTGPVSLLVTTASVAGASGGVKVDFPKVSFYYYTIKGYKVVTWSLHGRTYALVSQEGNSTQRSCMVCHSLMRDRDLTQTPTPLHDEPVLH